MEGEAEGVLAFGGIPESAEAPGNYGGSRSPGWGYRSLCGLTRSQQWERSLLWFRLLPAGASLSSWNFAPQLAIL